MASMRYKYGPLGQALVEAGNKDRQADKAGGEERRAREGTGGTGRKEQEEKRKEQGEAEKEGPEPAPEQLSAFRAGAPPACSKSARGERRRRVQAGPAALLTQRLCKACSGTA